MIPKKAKQRIMTNVPNMKRRPSVVLRQGTSYEALLQNYLNKFLKEDIEVESDYHSTSNAFGPNTS